MEEDSMEEDSMEEDSSRILGPKKQMRGIWPTQRIQETPGMHSGGAHETPTRHPAGSRHPRDTQTAPRNDPGDTHKAGRDTQKAHEGTQEAGRGPEGSLRKHAIKLMRFNKKWRERPFRVDGSDVTLTKSAACHGKLATGHPGQSPPTLHPASKTIRQNTSV